MSYYNRPMGDYGTGGYGYPQGDPGLFSILGKIATVIVPKVIKFFKKPVVQAVVGAAAGAGAIEAGQQMIAAGPGIMPTAPMLPPAAGFPGVGLPAIARMPGAVGAFAGGVCPAGYHTRKDRRLPFKCVRDRRMNIANPRALRRGIGRLKGIDKLARKTIRVTKRVR